MAKFPKAAAAACLLLALTACSDDSAHHADSVRVALTAVPSSVYPGAAHDRSASAVILATYQTPLTYQLLGERRTLTPQLAAALPQVSEDGLTVTLTIRSDAVFVDDPVFPDGQGRAVTADDVAYSILRHFDPALPTTGAALWRDHLVGIQQWNGDYDAPPAGIEVVDGQTVHFRLVAPTYGFLHSLATAKAAVVPREAEQRYGDELARRSVGSGPYVLTHIDSARATLEHNPRYMEKRYRLDDLGYDGAQHDARLETLEGERLPIIPRVDLEFVPDSASRWLSFQNDELDVIPVGYETITHMLLPSGALQLAPPYADRYTLHLDPSEEVVVIRVRMDEPDIGHNVDSAAEQANRELRCAVAQAMDWDDRREAFFQNSALIVTGVIPESLPEYDPNTANPTPYDPAAAQRVFQQQAQQRGQLPLLRYGHIPRERKLFDKFLAHMVAAGYPRDRIEAVQYAKFSDYLKGAMDGRHNLSNVGWTLSSPVAENVLQLFYGPNAAPGANLGNYASAAFDQAFERLQRTGVQSERTTLVQSMNAQLMADCSYLGTLGPIRMMLSKKALLGRASKNSTLVGRYFEYLAWGNEG